jgi:hypothetical protein
MMNINGGGADAYLDDVKKVPRTRRGLGPPVKEFGDRL